MNEETMKKYMDEAEQRLQRLEDNLTGKQAKPKKTEEKETDVDKFINQMKAINTTPAPDEGTDENDFIQMMKDMNQ